MEDLRKIIAKWIIIDRAWVKVDHRTISRYKINERLTIEYQGWHSDGKGAVFMQEENGRFINIWSFDGNTETRLYMSHNWGTIYYTPPGDFLLIRQYIEECCSHASAIWKRYAPAKNHFRRLYSKTPKIEISFCKK